jgi:hypothetical protein
VARPTQQTKEERQSAMTFYSVLAVIALASAVVIILAERYL